MHVRKGLVFCLLLAASVAGCGGSDGNDGVATAGSPGSKASSSAGTGGGSAQDQALKFAQCMRDNGVPNFPDPKFGDGGGMSLDVPDGSDPQKVDAAMKTCKQYLPNGGEPAKIDPARVDQNRKFAQCMRDNGVAKFPDPGADGGIQINGNDLNVDDPKFQAAQKACAQYLPSGGAPGNQTGGNG
jgi:hypothetical protein